MYTTEAADTLGRRIAQIEDACGNPDCDQIFTGHYNRRYCSPACARHAAYLRNDGKNAKTPEQRRENRLKTRYSMTSEQWEALFASQGRVCAICQTESSKRLHVDHCHITGAVRGILCHTCNVGIGQLGDDLETLLQAVAYLRRFA